MTEAASLGEAIQGRRKAVGLTQADLAAMVGFTVAQTVSDIERGQREVKAWELVRIAQALRTSTDELLGIAAEEPRVKVLWRRGSSAASTKAEEVLLDRARRYALLEKWNELPPPQPLPEFAIDPEQTSYRDAANMAITVGRAMNLGSRPAASLASVLQEVFRVKLFFDDLGDDESAASTRGDFGLAILMNRKQAPWRQNYNLAHELFHLVTWESTQRHWGAEEGEPVWLEKVERLANAFASHLLLPAEEVEAQYAARFPDGQIAYPDLVEMAREFDVSTEALIWRLRLLDKLSQAQAERILADPDFRREDRRSMPHHWGGMPEGPLPRRYWRLALNAYHRGSASLGRIAQMLESSVSEIGNLVTEESHEPEAAASPA
ncbi:MAG TPA: XRE family transcriptional regulator [Planctomycetota bacterium]|nr:XRE family transcriptional regulator [Planctomycetota bacterium]